MSNYAVFNLANKNTAIVSNRGPSLRILGLALSLECAKNLESKQIAETRIWPMSCASKINWRSVSNIDLLAVPQKDIEALLLKEYYTFEGRIASWNAYRNAKSVEVFESARLKERRPYHQLYAENLLQRVWPIKNTSFTTLSAPVDDATVSKAAILNPEEENCDVPERAYEVVPDYSREHEIRGQEWALIAIVGDTEYESAKEKILDSLGYKYFDLLVAQNQPSKFDSAEACNDCDVSKVEVQDSISGNEMTAETEKHFINTVARQAKLDIEALVKEPLIAFFGVSDEPSQLLKLSSELSKEPDLLNADIAVVRMYSWLALNSSSKATEHTARDPRAKTFFKAMRETLN